MVAENQAILGLKKSLDSYLPRLVCWLLLTNVQCASKRDQCWAPSIAPFLEVANWLHGRASKLFWHEVMILIVNMGLLFLPMPPSKDVYVIPCSIISDQKSTLHKGGTRLGSWLWSTLFVLHTLPSRTWWTGRAWDDQLKEQLKLQPRGESFEDDVSFLMCNIYLQLSIFV